MLIKLLAAVFSRLKITMLLLSKGKEKLHGRIDSAALILLLFLKLFYDFI